MAAPTIWTVDENILIGQPIESRSTIQEHDLGTIVRAKHPTYGSGEFIYLLGVASNTANSWITYAADNFGGALLAANAIGPVGVSMSAFVADEYGWAQIGGKAIGKALTGYADNGLVYATATAGSVDDAVVAGDRVKSARGASAVGTPSAGLAEFEIHRPFMDDGSAA